MKHRFFSQKLARWLLPALIWLVLPACALGEALDIGSLTPAVLPAQQEAGEAALYLGPTQGFLREGDAALDTAAPFVCFGQADCWAMVAQGTLGDMGAVGWIESAAANLPEEPLLGFDDALSTMVEEDTFLTVTPFGESPAALCALARGTQVLLLAQMEGWAYVQTEIEGTPVRAFLPVSAIL